MQSYVNIKNYHVSVDVRIPEYIVSLGDEQRREKAVQADVTAWEIQDNPLFDHLKDRLYVYLPDYRIKELWGVVYGPGDYAKTHIHSGFDLSFVWYLDACTSCAPLIFPDFEHPWMPPLGIIEPNPGELVVFPSHSEHYVPPQTCKHRRVVISGNLYHLDNCPERP